MALLNRTRVGMIDFDPAIRREFAAVFNAQPDFAVVGAAESGACGLELVRSRPLDVLLVDPALQDADGVELIQQCLALQRRCEVVVLTVFDSDQLVREAFGAGAVGYLLKDRRSSWCAALPDRIDDTLRSLRDGGAPVAPAIASRLRRLLQSESGGIGRGSVGTWPTHARSAPGADCRAGSVLLSAREAEILRLVSKGLTDARIGALLSISAYTVGTHVKNIYRKLEVHSRTEAVYEARNLGLVHD